MTSPQRLSPATCDDIWRVIARCVELGLIESDPPEPQGSAGPRPSGALGERGRVVAGSR